MADSKYQTTHRFYQFTWRHMVLTHLAENWECHSNKRMVHLAAPPQERRCLRWRLRKGTQEDEARSGCHRWLSMDTREVDTLYSTATHSTAVSMNGSCISAAQAGEPACLAVLSAFAQNMLLTCRRAGNPWRSPVCLNGTRGLLFSWGLCCSPRRAKHLVCPSCMLVNGTRQWDSVRTRAHSHSHSLSLPVTNTSCQRAVRVM